MSQSEFLLGFFGVSAADVTAENTSWVEVMITGEKMKNGGKTFTITRDDLDTYASDIRERGGQKRIPLDYDHSYMEGGSTLASGWFTGQADIRETDGKPSLWAEVQWTLKAADSIRSGEYAYISPEFSFQTRTKEGVLEKARQILAATLTNRPFFDRMAPVQIASRRDDGTYEPFPSPSSAQGAQEDNMPDTIGALVRKNLGLPDEADDAAVTAAIAAKDDEIAALKADKTELEKRPEVDKSEFEGIKASAARAEAAVEELRVERRDALLTKAVDDRKIDPVEKPHLSDLYDVKPAAVVAMLEARPAKPKGPIGHSGSSDDDDTTSARAGLRLAAANEDEQVEGLDIAAKVTAKLKEQNIANPTQQQYLEALSLVS